MRVKTDKKRMAIVEAAEAVFRERGYEATSMAEVSMRLGGSKQTLYSYFKSKSELFAAVMLEKGATQALPIFAALQNAADLETGLATFGIALLNFLMRDEIVAMRRLIMAEGAKSDLGQIFYENGPKRGLTMLANDFLDRMDRGEMRRADPWSAATHLMALLESGPFQRRMEGALEAVSQAELEKAVRDSLDVFVRAYR